jgi:hypothetical protein
MSKFHITVKDCVDRILLFDEELIGELECADSESVTEKIFNGELDNPVDAAFLCYILGESYMDVREVFSRPPQSRPDDANNDVMGNAICVNYFKPKTEADIVMPAVCIVDIPERLQLGLGIPSTIILQKVEFDKETADAEDLAKHGLDIKADGHFIKHMAHLWATDDFMDEKIKVSLYGQLITKHLDV